MTLLFERVRRSVPGQRPDHGAPHAPRPASHVLRRGGHRRRRLRPRDVLVLVLLVAVAGIIHATGMSTYPMWIDDPGTYLSQAWAVQYLHALSPYSYFYDHAPLGWLLIAGWSALTNGFGRTSSAMDFGNECMLIAKLISVVLMYLLCRRLRMHTATSVAAVLTFAASPLALHYTRLTYLDNIVTPWLLLTFLLATDPRKHLASVAGASVAFAGACLSKETTLIAAPALALALWQNSDRLTRDKCFAMAGFGASWMVLYPIYAIINGELLNGPGHTSLIGTAWWQLHQRTPSGSVLDAHSITHALWGDWLQYDHLLLELGAAATVAALAVRRLRAVALVGVCFGSVLFTGGYVPFMHVINLVPWLAVALFGVVDELARMAAARARPGRRTVRTVVLALGLGLPALLVVPSWVVRDRQMMTVAVPCPLAQADTWVANNVPRSKTVVVHDSLWTDLVAKDAFPLNHVIIVYKVDSDPTVNRSLRRIDYLVLPDYYYLVSTAAAQYPTVLAARQRAVAVAHFGTDPKSSVTVYRVSRTWTPRPAHASA